MRRALLRVLPAFAAYYGMTPWEVVPGTPHGLTFAELDEFRRQFPKPPKPTKRRR